MASSHKGLDPLQARILSAFRDVDGLWLTGGSALGGFHFRHRRSHDLDWFMADADRMDEMGMRLEAWCRTEGLDCKTEQSWPGFRRYQVSDCTSSTLVDLVHEPVQQVVPPEEKPWVEGVRVDPVEEIRANKLAALLGRSETKDLLDLYVIDREGWPALAGLDAAAMKDGGIEPSILAWVLSNMRIDLEGLLLEQEIDLGDLTAFRDRLVKALQVLAWPTRPSHPPGPSTP